MSSYAHSRWKVVGTDCTQNWKSLLLRMTPAQISAMPLAMVETTTARIKDVDIWPCGAGPWGAVKRKGSINRRQRFISWHKKWTANTSWSLFVCWAIITYLQRWYKWCCRWQGLHRRGRRDRGWGECLHLVCSSAFDSGCSSAALWSHIRRDSPWLEGTMYTHKNSSDLSEGEISKFAGF